MKLIAPLVIVACGVAIASAPSAEPVLSRFEFAEPHMGTRFRIVLYAPNKQMAEKAAKAAFARIAELDGIMSDYRSSSELMRLCKKADGAPVRVSEDLFYVLQRAQEVSRRCDGAFDVTVGPVVRLWRRSRRTQQLPDPEQLAQARELVGYEKVRLNEKDRSVQLTQAGMQLDLGGIGKGYAADAALKVLKQHGITRALVAAAGDIAVSGPPPDTPAWKVAIHPLDPEQKSSRFLSLRHAAVSTSGDTEQFVEIGDKRYSHIVDPKTGMGLVGRMSATVLAKDGTASDSLAKVVCVLGPERGLKLIEATDGAAALFVRRTDEGVETFESKRFSTFLFSRDR
ncbi:MAG TPA: FAD:protein FMN transferase [Gemmataceae bacterium]|nr:FAD:protein FMN transferase [Gemmataceae bacterium]